MAQKGKKPTMATAINFGRRVIELPHIPFFRELNGDDLLYLMEQAGVEVIEPAIQAIADIVPGEGERVACAPNLVSLGLNVPAEIVDNSIVALKLANWQALVSLAVSNTALPEQETIIAVNAVIPNDKGDMIGTLRAFNGRRLVGLVHSFRVVMGCYWLAIDLSLDAHNGSDHVPDHFHLPQCS